MIHCPNCNRNLSTLFLLTRWNPYQFQCPHCATALSISNATLWITLSVLCGSAFAGIAIYAEKTGFLPKWCVPIVITASLVVLQFASAPPLIRQGRITIEPAAPSSQRFVGPYNFVLVILIPAILLIMVGVGSVLTSNIIHQTGPALAAKQERLLALAKSGEISAEQANILLVDEIQSNRKQEQFMQKIKGMFFKFGTIVGGVAIWLLGAGYFAFKSSNNARQGDGHPSVRPHNT